MTDKDFNSSAFNCIPSISGYFVLDNVIVDRFTGLVYDTKSKQIVWECSNEVLVFNNIEKQGIEKNQELINSIITGQNKEENIQLGKQRLQAYFDKLLEVNDISTLERIEDYVTVHLIQSLGEYMYGHIFDIFQKALVVEKLGITDYSLLCSSPIHITDMDQHLKALFTSHSEVHYNNFILSDVWYNGENKSLVFVKKLLYVKPISEYFTFTYESLSFLRNKYFNHFDIDKKAMPNLKLFLDRNSNNIGRNIQNYESLHNSLADNNITVIKGNESLSETVDLLSKATHVAGIHGSKFVNTIFCPSVTKFREYCPKAKTPESGEDFSIYKSQLKMSDNYQVIKYDSVTERDDYHIDIEDLLSFYNQS